MYLFLLTIYFRDEKIREFQFLEEDEFEKILYIKKEDLAVSLPWYTSIIINFWTEDINLNYLNGIRLLFMNKTIKNLQEITFKFFTKIPLDSILFLFKYKVIHGQDIQYIHIELNFKDQYDILIAKEISQLERTPEEICKQTLNDICFEYLIILGKIQSVKDQNYIIGIILKHQFESLLLHFNGFQKLVINKNLDDLDEALLQVEIYFYEKWLGIDEEKILNNFDEIHNSILKYLENKSQCSLDIAFILNETQAQQQDLVVILNQFMITIFLKTQLSMIEIKLFIMPFQIYFTYDIQELQLSLDMNLLQQDNIDISSDGVLILLNALNQCKQINSLQIKVSLPEESENRNFHLFKYAMIMNEMSLVLKNGATFIYNDQQIVPFKGQLKLLGKYDLYLDEHTCIYDIRYLRCIDLQKELIAIIQYLILNNLKIRVLDIACDGGEFNLSSNKFKLDISHRICCLPYLLNFRLNFKGSVKSQEETHQIDSDFGDKKNKKGDNRGSFEFIQYKMNQDNIQIEDITFTDFTEFKQIEKIMPMIDQELSEPYSIYTYRYFLYGWPDLTIFAYYQNEIIGAVIGKLDKHQKSNRMRGYIAMIVVDQKYRRLRIGKLLAQKFIDRIKEKGGEEIVLETEQTNLAALRLYESLGFAKVKRMQNYYMSGNDAFRLKLFFVNPQDPNKQ
ncbi:hypothetical protein pb186bvf_011182 [Paramecium bursaria]